MIMIFLRFSYSGIRNRAQDLLYGLEVLYLSDVIFEITEMVTMTDLIDSVPNALPHK